MKNKVLIKLIVPEFGTCYDVFIPVNEYIWKVKKLMIKSISDITSVPLDINMNCYLLNKQSCIFYDDNEIVINTDIRNGTELFLISL
jgi:uncharacterized protein (UPF0254 family)